MEESINPPEEIHDKTISGFSTDSQESIDMVFPNLAKKGYSNPLTPSQ